MEDGIPGLLGVGVLWHVKVHRIALEAAINQFHVMAEKSVLELIE